MKKIAICSPYIGSASETFIRRHMTDLLPDRTVVIAQNDQEPQGGKWKVTSPTLLLRKVKPGLAVRGLNFLLGNRRSLKDSTIRKFLTSHQVAVIMAEYLDYSLRFLPVAKSLNIPVFAHAHGYDISLRLRDEFWRKEYLKLNEAAGVITMSEYSRTRLLALGLKPEKIHVIPYGTSVPDFAIEPKKNAEVRLLAVGRMVAKKAPVLLLDSFRRAAEINPYIHLDYVGAGPFLTAAQHYIQALRLEKRVTLHGAIDNHSVLKLMRDADLFVQHSVTCPETGDEEGMPVAILEAMAFGLPVISTIHAGIPEAVVNSETGLLVGEGETIAMGASIAELAGQPQLRIKMGQAGRARVQNRFTWEKERNALLNLLNMEG